jgi:hypothetical protein
MRLTDILIEAREGYLYQAIPLFLVNSTLAQDREQGSSGHMVNGRMRSGTSFTRSYNVAFRFFRDFELYWPVSASAGSCSSWPSFCSCWICGMASYYPDAG